MSEAINFRCPLIVDKGEWAETPAGAPFPLVRCISGAVEKPPQACGNVGNRRCLVWYWDESSKQEQCYEATQLAKFSVREPL
jgi:hypothetical protein